MIYFLEIALMLCLALGCIAESKELTPDPDGSRSISLSIKRYRIGHVEGQILSWDPWTSSWNQIKSGSTVWENTLVQIGPGGKFTFAVASEKYKGVKTDSIEVTLNTPIVIRLDEDIMRATKLSSYFIPQPPKKATESVGELFNSINSAWEKFAAMLVSQGLDLAFLKNQRDTAGEAAVALRAKRIHIYTPPDNITAFADKLPTELRISWRRVADQSLDYEIRVWRFDEARPSGALAVTQLDFHNVKLMREGGYFLQVTTSDGKWQSPVQRVFVALPLRGRIEDKEFASGEKRPLPLLLPPKDFIYSTREFPVWMAFQWETMTPASPRTQYELTVTDSQGKELLKRKVGDRAFQAKFNAPGKYSWSVQGFSTNIIPGLEPSHFVSEKRTFTLEAAPTLARKSGGATSDRIAEMLLTKSSGVLYLEEGF